MSQHVPHVSGDLGCSLPRVVLVRFRCLLFWQAEGNADGLDGTDWSNQAEYRCDFPRVAAADLLAAKTAAEREALIGGEVVIITGAISDWKARDRWASPAAFNERYGDHEIRGWHSRRGRAMVGQEGAYPVSEYLADFDQEHGVVYAKAPWEANLHEAINEDWAIPEYLAAASIDRTLSLGGGSWGAPFQRHQVAWLGLVGGRKYWEVAPPHEPHPAKPECQDYDAQRKKPVRQCVMRPGELAWVPDRWWHASVELFAGHFPTT